MKFKSTPAMVALIATFATWALLLSNSAKAQPTPPDPPVPFEMNNSFFSGTVNVLAPVFYVGTNANSVVPPGTVIAPITFSGTVNDIENITYTYSRRTKLWTMNFVPGSFSVASSTILSNMVLLDLDEDGNKLDTNIAGWTFGAEVDQWTGQIYSTELFKVSNNVVVRREYVPGLDIYFFGEPALRTGSITFNASGEPSGINASSREGVDVEVGPEAYTTSYDPDATYFYLGGIFSNTLTSKTNTWVEPGSSPPTINTNLWYSPAGTAAIQGLGN